jgi:hypothetical protein
MASRRYDRFMASQRYFQTELLEMYSRAPVPLLCYKKYPERSWRRLAVSGRYLVDPDGPQPVDQQIDNLVVVLLQHKPELDRAQAHAALRKTVDRLLAESSQ